MKEIAHGKDIDSIYGVFDGHGGSEVSIMCKCILPHVLEWNLKKLSNGYSDDKSVRIRTALTKTIRDMDRVIMTPEG